MFDLLDLATPPEKPRDLTLLRVSRRAMATKFEIAIPVGTPHALDAANEALDLIDALEDQLTIYRESEVTRLNATAAEQPVIVEKNLFALLQQCAILTNDTAGAFDAAAGTLSRCWGFTKREGRIPTYTELAEAVASTGFRHVILNADTEAVRFRRAGLEINLGAIGKGYALDRAAELLQSKWNITSALLAGSGSSVLALGRPPTDFRGWGVSIRHPSDDSRTLGTVYLKDSALGTSAATYQSFEYNGRTYGHVIDPRTGQPADGMQSASCVAPTAAEADAISTAFFVAGSQWAAEYCKSRTHLGAVLLPKDAEAPESMNLDFYDPPGLRLIDMPT
jgi:thiamine biosynthesis lipoprotein